MPKAVSENLSLKQTIFKELAAELRPEAILATNTSSISITKIAASAVPKGVAPASKEGKESTSRVVGMNLIHEEGLEVDQIASFLQDCTSSTLYLSWCAVVPFCLLSENNGFCDRNWWSSFLHCKLMNKHSR
jgi:hypothetical protein